MSLKRFIFFIEEIGVFLFFRKKHHKASTLRVPHLLLCLATVCSCSAINSLIPPSRGAFSHALKRGDVARMKREVKRGIDLNTALIESEEGFYPIHHIASGDTLAEEQQLRTLSFLIESGANLEVKDAKGRTALIIAAGAGRIARYNVVNLLVQKGAYLDEVDDFGCSSLMYAARNNDKKVAAVLLRDEELVSSGRVHFSEGFNLHQSTQTANPNMIDWVDKTALIYAIESVIGRPNADLTLVNRLIRHGADVNYNIKGKDGSVIGPLETAYASGDQRVINLLRSDRHFDPYERESLAETIRPTDR